MWDGGRVREELGVGLSSPTTAETHNGGRSVWGRGGLGAGTKAVESRDNGPVFLEHRVL